MDFCGALGYPQSDKNSLDEGVIREKYACTNRKCLVILDNDSKEVVPQPAWANHRT